MNRLRRAWVPLLATLCLAGLPACAKEDVKREANQAGTKAKHTGKKAANQAEKAKQDVDGQ